MADKAAPGPMKGSIAEQGTHEELVALNGLYHKLVQRQLQVRNKWSLSSPPAALNGALPSVLQGAVKEDIIDKDDRPEDGHQAK